MVFLAILTSGLVFQGLMHSSSVLVLTALAVFGGAPCEVESQEKGSKDGGASATGKDAPPFRFQPGKDTVAVTVPRGERLVYRAYLDFALGEARVGTVTQTCTVQGQAAPVILVDKAAAPAGEMASIKLQADGKYFVWELESTLETRILPQDWPRLYYQMVSKSSRGTRRREVLVGRKEGAPVASYRGDTDKGAPAGTRIWRAAQERPVPEGTLDMLTAVFMARALVREKKDVLTFPLIDKTRLWSLDLRRGKERRIETGAGTFDAFEVVLEPKPYPGESFEEKAKEFEGVFGIHGTIHLWVDKRTGIAVRIQGDLPINDGMITLGIDVVLDSYSGTPADFTPVPVTKER